MRACLARRLQLWSSGKDGLAAEYIAGWSVAFQDPAAHKTVTFSLQYLAIRISGALYLQTWQRSKWQQQSFSSSHTGRFNTQMWQQKSCRGFVGSPAGSERHSETQVTALQAIQAGLHHLQALTHGPACKLAAAAQTRHCQCRPQICKYQCPATSAILPEQSPA